MDVLNKFRSTVTNTMSQLSTVLPGNPVTREYEATKHIASAGVGVYFHYVFVYYNIDIVMYFIYLPIRITLENL